MISVAIRLLASALIATSLAACRDTVEKRYADLAEARRDGAVDRGWIPDFVPDSAHNFHDVHDLDNNAQTLSFTVATSDVPAMVAGLTPLSPPDVALANRALKSADPASSNVVVAVCARASRGWMAVDVNSGRSTYVRAIDEMPRSCGGSDR